MDDYDEFLWNGWLDGNKCLNAGELMIRKKKTEKDIQQDNENIRRYLLKR